MDDSRTTQKAQQYRIEHDSLGTLEVPAHVYWGINTQRALTNFPVSGVPDSSHPEMIVAYAQVKRACAIANYHLGLLSKQRADLISKACKEIEEGALLGQFPIDVLQGGAGTSLNMNMNEVIANRALELGGWQRGQYEHIHPNDHVNHSQSTNDTYPAAIKLALFHAVSTLLPSLEALAQSFHSLADRHILDVTIGRTQLQDAVPMTFGQEFHAFSTMLRQDTRQLREVQRSLLTLNLGATAIGTGICADARFRTAATEELARITGLEITAADDPVAAMTDMSAYVSLASALKNTAIHLKKAADDIRLLASGPHAGFDELRIPARQAGSSIMPAKVNPVIAECLNQCCFRVFGMETAVYWAASEGQLQLNAFDPVIVHELLKGIAIVRGGIDTFRKNCVEGIEINADRARNAAVMSPSIAAALNDRLGYEKAASIAKYAVSKHLSIAQAAHELTDIPQNELDTLLDPATLSRKLGQTCKGLRE